MDARRPYPRRSAREVFVMANPLSTLGIVHTAISLVPLVAGLWAFY
ncbi:hypothetical protein [Pseudomonas sp. 30_B]|nr:hypothetical protein [Pseudomonas sp. 30_B]